MKLFVDQHRQPDVDWVWAKTAHCAITLMRGGNVERISFPPDQADITTEVVEWMIAHDIHPIRTVHSYQDRAA